MLNVIVNTTPILSLLKIDKLDLLHIIYGKVTIPFAVYVEIEKGKQKPWYVDLQQVEYFEIAKVRDYTKSGLFNELDIGEAEVLMLAIEQNADFVIIDETLGRKYAASLGIKLTGTIGILLRAKQLGLINNVSKLLNIMKDQGTWLNPKLLEKVREITNE